MWRKSASVLLVHQGSYIAGVQQGPLRRKPTCCTLLMCEFNYILYYSAPLVM